MNTMLGIYQEVTGGDRHTCRTRTRWLWLARCWEKIPMADTYGARFKACRRAMGLTQDEVSGKIGLTRSSVANIERDGQRSLIDDVARYAEVFGVDPAWLAYGRVTVEGQPLPKPRTVASTDLVKLSDDLQALAARAMKLSAVADPEAVEEVPLGSGVDTP
jgi:transcriptional regulator with XRE-family HTH domain